MSEPKRRILIVDDEPDILWSLSLLLERDYDVTTAEDGKTALQALADGPYHAVILDLMMPGITGFEVCEQLRASVPTARTPILALTGYDTLQNEDKIKAAGASGYMAKPFEVPKFISEIERLCERGKRGV